MRRVIFLVFLTAGALASGGFFLCSKRKPTQPPPVVVEKPCEDLDSTLTFTCCRQDVRDPAWFPDGKTIAYANVQTDPGVHLVNPDGTNDRNILRSFLGSVHLDISSDGQWILFTWGRTDQPQLDGIYKVRVTGKDTTLILIGRDNSYPRWSSDDKIIAFERETFVGDTLNGVYLMNADGTWVRQILRFGQVPDWSLDGRLVVNIGTNLYIIDTLGNILSKLTDFRADSLGRGIRVGSGRWSPGGDLILFTAYENWTDRSYLMTVRPDGTGMQKVPNTLGNIFPAAWAPDNRHVVYTDGDTTKHGIYTVSILGCNKTLIAKP